MEVANSEVLSFDHEEKEKNRAILAPHSISLGCLCVAVRVSSYFPSLGSCTLSYHMTLLGEASLDQAHSLCDSIPPGCSWIGPGEDPLLKLDQFRKLKNLVSLNTNRSVMLLTKVTQPRTVLREQILYLLKTRICFLGDFAQSDLIIKERF